MTSIDDPPSREEGYPVFGGVGDYILRVRTEPGVEWSVGIE